MSHGPTISINITQFHNLNGIIYYTLVFSSPEKTVDVSIRYSKLRQICSKFPKVRVTAT